MHKYIFLKPFRKISLQGRTSTTSPTYLYPRGRRQTGREARTRTKSRGHLAQIPREICRSTKDVAHRSGPEEVGMASCCVHCGVLVWGLCALWWFCCLSLVGAISWCDHVLLSCGCALSVWCGGGCAHCVGLALLVSWGWVLLILGGSCCSVWSDKSCCRTCWASRACALMVSEG